MAVVLDFLPFRLKKSSISPPKVARPRDGPLAEQPRRGVLVRPLSACGQTVAADQRGGRTGSGELRKERRSRHGADTKEPSRQLGGLARRLAPAKPFRRFGPRPKSWLRPYQLCRASALGRRARRGAAAPRARPYYLLCEHGGDLSGGVGFNGRHRQPRPRG